MFGPRPRPLISAMTYALFFDPPLALATSNARIIFAITSKRAHCTSRVNDTDFDGFTKEPIPVGGPFPLGITPMCRICKEPPTCIALCQAKIFYVHGNDTTQPACIHLGNHRYPVKVGNCRHSRKRIDALIEEHVKRTPQTSHSKKKFEASKDLVGQVLLPNDNGPHQFFSLEELEPVFLSLQRVACPHLRNKVTTFKYLHRLGIIDGIAKLRGVSTRAYV
jgi:hypothetical protein